MMVSIDQLRSCNRYFKLHNKVTRCVSFSDNINSSLIFLSMMFYYVFSGTNILFLGFLYIFTIFLCHGDAELNLGPKRFKQNYLSI